MAEEPTPGVQRGDHVRRAADRRHARKPCLAQKVDAVRWCDQGGLPPDGMSRQAVSKPTSVACCTASLRDDAPSLR